MYRKLYEPDLIMGEEIIMRGQASYDAGSSHSDLWKLGHLYLSEKHLFFLQGQKTIFKIALNKLKEVKIVKRTWAFGKIIKQLCLILRNPPGGKVVYIGIENPEKWKNMIENMITKDIYNGESNRH